MNEKNKKLEEICAEAMAKYLPKDVDNDGDIDITYCNLALNEIALLYCGIKDFKGKLANQIYELLKSDARWMPINGESAQLNSIKGHFCIAAQQNNPHGHVATVLPRGLVYSSKWQKYVPMVANVGKRNGAMGVNFAFRSEPDYFMWMGKP